MLSGSKANESPIAVVSPGLNLRAGGMRSNLYGGSTRAAADSKEQQAARMNTAEMEEQVHRENEAMLHALGNSVASMRSMASNLHRGAEEQNQLLKGISDAFTAARGGVGSATAGVQKVVSRYGWRHTLFFALGMLLLLLMLYKAVKRS